MLDYTKREKKVLSVKLDDKTTLLLCPPKKTLFERLIDIEDRLKATADAMALYDELVNLSVEILAMDKGGRRFTAAEVEEMFDLEDMACLIFEYANYTGQITNRPN